jgi:DNA primase
MNADTSWKTVPNLTSKIADKLRDEVERTTNGNVKNFVQALQEADLPEIRKKLKSKFTVIDTSQIKAWEALLRNGIMNSTDKVFTECLDTEKKFRDLEELQNYLYNICPTQY